MLSAPRKASDAVSLTWEGGGWFAAQVVDAGVGIDVVTLMVCAFRYGSSALLPAGRETRCASGKGFAGPGTKRN